MPSVLRKLKNLLRPEALTPAARAEQARDRADSLSGADPGCWPVILANLDWLCRAQDHNGQTRRPGQACRKEGDSLLQRRGTGRGKGTGSIVCSQVPSRQ